VDEVIASFIASVPQIQSAFNLGGDGSARIKLDVPSSEIAEVVRLFAFGREQALQIIVLPSGEDLPDDSGTQDRILNILADGPTSVTVMGESLETSSGAVRVALTKLKAKGLVEIVDRGVWGITER